MTETWVRATFSASHNDAVREEVHGHSYEVWAGWSGDPYRDAVALQALLNGVLKGGFDHRTLPAGLSTGEALAAAIGGLMSGCIGVDLIRPVEGFKAVWRA